MKVLDAEGIDVVGDVPRARASSSAASRTPSSRCESCKVYNDWIAEWCAAAPDRLKGVGALPMQDPEAAADEAHRIRDARARRPASRARTRTTTGRSTTRRTRRCGRRSRRPASRSGCTSPGSPTCRARRARCAHLMAPGTHHALIPVIDQMMTLSNLVYGGVLERHPGLKVVVLECGGGWIAHWMDRLNEFVESYGWAAAPMSLDAEEYFQRQCWISFDPGERTPGAARPDRRRRPLHLGVRLPAQRRQVPRRGRRAARAQRRPARRRAHGSVRAQRARRCTASRIPA